MQSRAPPSIRRHARHTCPSRTLSAAAAAASIGSSSNPVSLLRNELLICAGNWMRPMMAKKNSGQSKVSRAPFKAATNQSGTLGSLCADVVIFHQPQRRNSALGLGPSKATRETEKNLVKLHHAASAREREREAEKSLGDDDTKASLFSLSRMRRPHLSESPSAFNPVVDQWPSLSRWRQQQQQQHPRPERNSTGRPDGRANHVIRTTDGPPGAAAPGGPPSAQSPPLSIPFPVVAEHDVQKENNSQVEDAHGDGGGGGGSDDDDDALPGFDYRVSVRRQLGATRTAQTTRPMAGRTTD